MPSRRTKNPQPAALPRTKRVREAVGRPVLSVTLSVEARDAADEVAGRLGISRSALIEMLIREKAGQMGVAVAPALRRRRR